jgi:hypothetical protein
LVRVDGNAVGAVRRRCTGLSGDGKLDQFQAGATSTARVELEARVARWVKRKESVRSKRREGTNRRYRSFWLCYRRSDCSTEACNRRWCIERWSNRQSFLDRSGQNGRRWRGGRARRRWRIAGCSLRRGRGRPAASKVTRKRKRRRSKGKEAKKRETRFQLRDLG